MYCCYSVPSPNEKSKILKKILGFLLFLEACLASAKWYFIASRFEFVSEIIAFCILFQALCQLNYCNCVIYILICIMNAFCIVLRLASQMQEGIELSDFSTIQHTSFIIVSAASVVFYVVSVYFAFQSYKEFKGIAYDILSATYNHEVSVQSQYKNPSKSKNLGQSSSMLKVDSQESGKNAAVNDKKYQKHK